MLMHLKLCFLFPDMQMNLCESMYLYIAGIYVEDCGITISQSMMPRSGSQSDLVYNTYTSPNKSSTGKMDFNCKHIVNEIFYLDNQHLLSMKMDKIQRATFWL